MPSLKELGAVFLHRCDDGSYSFGLDGAEFQQGVQFLCPLCYTRNGNSSRGTHSVICWFINPRVGPAVPDSVTPGPGRWLRVGETIETLTLGPGPSGMRSIKLTGGCCWHDFVTNGYCGIGSAAPRPTDVDTTIAQPLGGATPVEGCAACRCAVPLFYPGVRELDGRTVMLCRNCALKKSEGARTGFSPIGVVL